MPTQLSVRLMAPLILVGALAVVGCAGVPGETGPAPTSTATSSPEPAPSSAAPSVAPSPVDGAGYGPFTAEQLTQICIDATITTFASDVSFDAARTRIERRAVSPEWLVIVPATTSGLEGRSLCTVGGDPTSPVIELAAGSISELPEEQIQKLIRGENEGGDR